MSQKGGIVKFFALEDDTEFMIYEDLQPLPSLVPWSKRFQRTGTWKAIDMKVLLVGTVPCWWLKESQILTCLDCSEPCKIREKKRAGPLGSRHRRSSVDPSISSRSSVSDPKKERSAPLGSRHRRTSVFHAVIAYQVGHPSPSRLYFTYREKHLKENLYAPHWQS